MKTRLAEEAPPLNAAPSRFADLAEAQLPVLREPWRPRRWPAILSFRFPRRLDGGTPYSVRVYAQPASQLWTVAGAAGTIGMADVGNVQVACAPK